MRSRTRPQHPEATAIQGRGVRPFATAGGEVPNMDASTILRRAADIIEQRASLRDRKGFRANARAAVVFNALRDKDLTEEDISLVMIVQKLCRAAHGHDPDNYVDAAGYCGLAAEASERLSQVKK